ncbi:similar to Saccharomyces cerevisiae YJL144W Cytoplasmic hydrophilin with a role in dessication resistance [Maudiozyma saulgeensis]|uniref:Similar to Saccharomyces cerevisiae YJL144W Cytoplasmic hydrophilin with a role in dessication resistance n=1 Tax=Maudiozyma saulgeensis TaxID=1789683 RepID=A0A1X7RB13_9SACH|nr:similar to Saccharomyces cerevisiae YJL144W Cytoplasmic hydrophilin with a role in dessication resistance [Kazachstania saulgeensis]
MLRRDTASIHNNHTRTKHTIFRSKRVIPQYSDTLCGDVAPDAQEYRFGDFSVLNHTNHPGVVYYFIELTDPNGNPISSRSGNNNNDNNNNTHRI